MPDFCTCGAQLPPDARFCHRCGKPQREEPLLVEEPVAPPPPPATSPPPVEISFSNRLAVRIGLLAGTLALLLSSVPISPYLSFLWMMAAGGLSVYLYNRRSGRWLSVPAGARMGWMTGLFAFLISMVLLTAFMLLMQTEPLTKAVREHSAYSKETTEKLLQVLSSPGEFVLSLVMSFLTLPLLAALGGALGARVFRN